ncbi:MAG TPA: hypothetical protein VII98_06120 [Solirubrobacteraceae bacterium]
MPRRPALLLRTIGACAALLVVLAPASASARTSHDCPARQGTLATAPLGRVWHHAGSLYGCTTVYGVAPRAVRLGPWTAGTKVAFDGVGVAWTVRRTVGGQVVDRVWAASTQTAKRWLLGPPLVPASGSAPAREERIQRILLTDAGVAWVTRASDVVLALHEPSDAPTAIGTLPGALQPARLLLLVGSWPAVPAAQLAASAALKELPGDGDECGGANDYQLTVTPDPSAAAVGALWNGYWTRPDCG